MVDTNVALKVYLEEDLAEEAQKVLDAAREQAASLLAPSLILLEFRHALTKRNRRGELSHDEVLEIWEAFDEYPLILFEIEPLVPRAAQIVNEVGCTVYDAIFVALAEAEGAVMVTAERRLLNALKGTPFSDLLWPLSRIDELLQGTA